MFLDNIFLDFPQIETDLRYPLDDLTVHAEFLKSVFNNSPQASENNLETFNKPIPENVQTLQVSEKAQKQPKPIARYNEYKRKVNNFKKSQIKAANIPTDDDRINTLKKELKSNLEHATKEEKIAAQDYLLIFLTKIDKNKTYNCVNDISKGLQASDQYFANIETQNISKRIRNLYDKSIKTKDIPFLFNDGILATQTYIRD